MGRLPIASGGGPGFRRRKAGKATGPKLSWDSRVAEEGEKTGLPWLYRTASRFFLNFFDERILDEKDTRALVRCWK